VSAVTANVQLATRSHPHPNDVDTTSPFSISPKHSRISMRDLTPDDSESSCPLHESDSGPIDEEVDSEAGSLESPGPDDLDEPWPYTFRVSQSHPSAARGGR
jgi:hypothetical protein